MDIDDPIERRKWLARLVGAPRAAAFDLHLDPPCSLTVATQGRMRVAIHGARPVAKTNVVVNHLKAEQTGD